MPSAGEEVKKQELSLTTGGKAKWCGHFGRLAVTYKTEHGHKIPFSNMSHRYLPNEMKIYAHMKICTRNFLSL